MARSTLDAQLEERINAGRELEDRAIHEDRELQRAWDDFETWNDFNVTLLKRSFTTAEEAEKYIYIGPGFFSMDPTLEEKVSYFKDPLHERVQHLVSLKGRLGLFDEPQPHEAAASGNGVLNRTEIFIVHGHDGAAKLAVARFVEQVTSHAPIILHEQANRGRTIIEKFEDMAATVAFAIVLLTGDDKGGEGESVGAKPRARQNVIFEMGFFVGTIGRSRVAVIYEGGVELPSDMSGILYIPLDDAGAWKLELAREMREAQVDIDLNKAL